MTKHDRPVYSAVFGTYGQYTVVCTIRQSGTTLVAGNITPFTYMFDGQSFYDFAAKAVANITKLRDLPLANEHVYRHNLGLLNKQ